LGNAAYAEIALSIAGTYGDPSGCNFKMKGNFTTDSGTYLSSNVFGGYEWSCEFVWAHEAAGSEIGAYDNSQVWSVIALCAAEGEAFSQLLSIQKFNDTVTVSGGGDQSVLKLCE